MSQRANRLWRSLALTVLALFLLSAPGLADASKPTDLFADSDALTVYPTPAVSGDVVSLRVTAHNGSHKPLMNIPAVVYRRDGDKDTQVARVTINYIPPGGQGSATAEWVWDTKGLVGPQPLVVHVDPDNNIAEGDENAADNVAVSSISLDPPPPGPGPTWASVDTACCTLHYITGTAAERDIASLMSETDASVAHVQQTLNITLAPHLQIYLVPRTLGQGGFTAGHIVLSYLDRQYAAGFAPIVIRHEATHALQAAWTPGESPLLLSEGLAVWVAGGHFKPEPIRERAATLLALNRYVPLDQLVDNFYDKQHETGYLEAAGLIQYLVETHGQDKLKTLFSNLQRRRGDRDKQVLERGFQAAYGKSIAEIDADYRAWLADTPPDPTQQRDLVDTARLFDLMRSYQQTLDPTAYFRTPWMPPIEEAERRGLVADYLRHPQADVNKAIEALFLRAADEQAAEDYDSMEHTLDVVDGILAAHASAPNQVWADAFADPLAAAYLDAVRTLQAAGFEPQRILIDSGSAQVWATRSNAASLYRLTMTQEGDGWHLLEWVSKEDVWLPG
ncbi:MAG: hypothetical protein U0822_20210 [Anaerolineae bacterium]